MFYTNIKCLLSILKVQETNKFIQISGHQDGMCISSRNR